MTLAGGARLRELIAKWREQANQSGLEATRIYNTVKEYTGAQDRCYARQELWKTCADELEAALEDAAALLVPPTEEDWRQKVEAEMAHLMNIKEPRYLDASECWNRLLWWVRTPSNHPSLVPSSSPAPQERWQPISTAPQGQVVLVCWASHPLWSPRALSKEPDGTWENEDGHSYRQPTHWMPLPDPPLSGSTPAPQEREK